MKSLSMVRLVIFLTISITLSIIYYKNILKVDTGGNKKILMVKHILGLFVLFGLLSVFSSVKDTTGKTIILVVLLLIINIFNVNQSITKCGYPTLYKVNLFGRSSFIIICISMLIYYSYEDDFFRFLYAESELDSSSKSFTNTYTVDELKDELKINRSMPPYCPDIPAEIENICVSLTNVKNSKCDDPDDVDTCYNVGGGGVCKFIPKYKTTKKWKTISSKQKNNCLAAHAAIYQRNDITDKLYA
jgi:hypothetical protein